jgi:hypothetical protein
MVTYEKRNCNNFVALFSFTHILEFDKEGYDNDDDDDDDNNNNNNNNK